MKKAMLLVSLLLAAMLLMGCSAQEQNFPDASAQVQKDPLTVIPTDAPVFNPSAEMDYDPMAEEDVNTYVAGALYDEYGNTLYAGATPIPVDPIDMPTATPRPSLTFSYGVANADNLKISFEAPVGWMVDTSAPDTVVLTDPQTYDNFNATMTIKISPVASGFKLADVKTEVKAILAEIGQYNYSTWETTDLAERTLLKKDGYYANYRGQYYDGTIVRGRVMVALLDNNQIITVHMAAPGWFNESYMNVVAHFRDTLKQIQ